MGYSPWAHKESDTTEHIHTGCFNKETQNTKRPKIESLKQTSEMATDDLFLTCTPHRGNRRQDKECHGYITIEFLHPGSCNQEP